MEHVQDPECCDPVILTSRMYLKIETKGHIFDFYLGRKHGM